MTDKISNCSNCNKLFNTALLYELCTNCDKQFCRHCFKCCVECKELVCKGCAKRCIEHCSRTFCKGE